MAHRLPRAYTLNFDNNSSASESSFGDGCKNLNDQDTVLFHDTEAIDSARLESEMGSCYGDTEPLNDVDFEEPETSGPTCNYEEEIVLDSEDEGMPRTNSNCVQCVSINHLSVEKVKGTQLASERRQPFEQEKDLPLDSSAYCGEQRGDKTSSVNVESTNRNCPPRLTVCDHSLDNNTDYIHSGEPGEFSQANALDFVDNLVLNDDINLSQRKDFMKNARSKSPLISRAKGTCTLAQRLKSRTETVNGGTFQWDDSKHQENTNVFSKRTEGPLLDQQKVMHSEAIGHGAEPEDKKESTLPQMGMPKCEKMTEGKWDAKLSEGADVEIDSSDVFDIGINTQIAVEAMEALFYGSTIDCNGGDAYQDPQTILDSPSGCTTKNMSSHMENTAPQRSPRSDVAKQSKERKHSVGSFSEGKSCKNLKRQKLDTELAKAKRMRRRKSPATRLVNSENSSCVDEDSRAILPASVPVTVQAQKNCINVWPVAHQSKPSTAANRLETTRDRLDKSSEQTMDIITSAIITYRRKRTSRNVRTVQQKQVSPVVAEVSTHLKLDPCNIIPRRKRTRLSTKRNSNDNAALTLKIVDKKESDNCCAKVQRRPRSKITCFSLCSKGRRWSSTEICAFGAGSEYADLSVDPEKQGPADVVINFKSAVNEGARPCVKEDLGKASDQCGNTDGLNPISIASYVEKYHECRESLKKQVELSGLKYARKCREGTDEEVSNDKFHEYSRKESNKNLPRSSLLKELIKLEVPESSPKGRWRELRRRRDVACICVLFSQHLGDDIVKQQKKIAARLGISITLCSKDATHFVADKFARTRNMLEAISLGKHVVTHFWLESCGLAGCLIDEKNYILRDIRKEKEIGFSMPISLARASQQPLLKGHRVFVTAKIKPDKEMITSLVNAVSGQIVEGSQIGRKSEKIPDDLLILSCEEDYAICKPYLNKGASVYGSELLLKGIVIQKLEYERHRLFMDHVKSYCRSTQSKKNRRSLEM